MTPNPSGSRLDRNDPGVREALASEYALGTLQGPARRRFERWLDRDADLRSRVERWELQLGSFVEEVGPHTPPSGTWQGILQEVESKGSKKAPVRNHPSLWNHLPLWRGAAIAATLLLAATLAWSLGSSPEPAMPERMAVVNSQDNGPLWVIAASRDSRTVRVRTVRNASMGPDQICPLWLRAEGAEKPRMVGVLPQEKGLYTLQLPREVSASLDRSELMVSVEAKGNMPTDRPRGQVMYRGDWIRL